MSGIVGIVNFDGAPADRALLSRMTAFMDFRGPDARNIWINQNVGFGHTLLRTTFEAEHETQPFTFDNNTHIVADCRIDAREELISKLLSRVDPQVCRGHKPSLRRPDVELILHAWHVWGEDCVHHLLGDFAFAIWDAPTRKLFCARDHMGVKPFYYAHIGQTLIFSNTLDCVRLHPSVSDKLNDLAIADYLLFGTNQEPDTTSFQDIQRIPAAHLSTWSNERDPRLALTRYWTLPIDEPIYFKRADDYTDRFKELLDQAVSDRLRTNKIGVFMSGGLDSPALAATARKALARHSNNWTLKAFTTVMDEVDHNERRYASIVAEHLGIPISFQDLAATFADTNWNDKPIHTAEPYGIPFNLKGTREYFKSLSGEMRVFFYGEGPDDALKFEWSAHLRYLAGEKKFGRMLSDIATHIAAHRRIPFITSLPKMARSLTARNYWTPQFPTWINDDLQSRLALRARWDEHRDRVGGVHTHRRRPLSYGALVTAGWENLFGDFEIANTKSPIEVRHPFLDIRVLRYFLAVPAIPWCRKKHLMRQAFSHILPRSIVQQPKRPLTADPKWIAAKTYRLPNLIQSKEVRNYISDSASIPTDMVNFRSYTRALALNYWIRSLNQEHHPEALEDDYHATRIETQSEERLQET